MNQIAVEAALVSLTMKDLAELLHAVAWPLVTLVVLLRFHGVIQTLLERLIHAEGMGVSLTLDKRLRAAEKKLKNSKPQLPPRPTRDSSAPE